MCDIETWKDVRRTPMCLCGAGNIHEEGFWGGSMSWWTLNVRLTYWKITQPSSAGGLMVCRISRACLDLPWRGKSCPPTPTHHTPHGIYIVFRLFIFVFPLVTIDEKYFQTQKIHLRPTTPAFLWGWGRGEVRSDEIWNNWIQGSPWLQAHAAERDQ